jgi:hypothetical protein
VLPVPQLIPQEPLNPINKFPVVQYFRVTRDGDARTVDVEADAPHFGLLD